MCPCPTPIIEACRSLLDSAAANVGTNAKTHQCQGNLDGRGESQGAVSDWDDVCDVQIPRFTTDGAQQNAINGTGRKFGSMCKYLEECRGIGIRLHHHCSCRRLNVVIRKLHDRMLKQERRRCRCSVCEKLCQPECRFTGTPWHPWLEH